MVYRKSLSLWIVSSSDVNLILDSSISRLHRRSIFTLPLSLPTFSNFVLRIGLAERAITINKVVDMRDAIPGKVLCRRPRLVDVT
mmetsp:Transcript_7334/g.17564  ORF Transcript_7334/g.17564 Transcript_7334/m.17564 type:complete len:85 (-) Transcript_7334:141-395(-)